MGGLTDKQQRFCEEYLIDLNATQSAIRAGYSEKTAFSIGCENLTKPNIQDYIYELQRKKSESINISQNDVLKELIKLGFSDIKNLFDDNGRLKDVNELENSVSSSLKSAVVMQEKIKTDGKTSYETTIKKVEQHDKLKALDMIAKMLGFYSVDNEQRKPVTNISLKDMIDFEQ